MTTGEFDGIIDAFDVAFSKIYNKSKWAFYFACERDKPLIKAMQRVNWAEKQGLVKLLKQLKNDGAAKKQAAVMQQD